MSGLGGLILALICIAVVGLAAGLAVATLTGREPHWLLPAVRVLTLGVAAGCFLLACLHQIAAALTP
ncbi:hypothetical protein [Streptomyces sp. NPDC056105]|uniref:hypothetical protein n=1 Tax=Streptomyces sp. NPDC056105 TaxID=3345714 RepID=UPI0035E0BFE8